MESNKKQNNDSHVTNNHPHQTYEELIKRYLPMVNRLTLSIWYRLRDETVFQRKCLDNLERMLVYYDPSRGRIESLAERTILSTKVKLLNDRKYPWKKFKSIDHGTSGDEDESNEVMVIKDDLAIVDDNLMVNERIASLAGDDSRRKFILKAWSEGYYNESELAALLAQRFGGNARSHCRFIQRFRIECQEKLLQTA